MQARRWGGIAVPVAAVLVAVVFAPALGHPVDPSRAAVLSARSDGVVPAALLAPWSARAGYVAGWATNVSEIHAYTGNVTVSFTFRPTDPQFFAPPSGAPLSVGQIADRYGLPASTYAAVQEYLTGQGFRILDTFADRLALTVEGPAAVASATFGTELASGI